MTTLTYVQMAQYLANAGFSQDQLATGAAVGMAESSGVTTATNTNSDGSVDYGFMQINSGSGGSTADFDPGTCAKDAYKLYASRKWQPWATYNSGAYSQFLPAAKLQLAGKTITPNSAAGTGTTDQLGTSGSSGPTATDYEYISAYSDMTKGTRVILGHLMDSKFWIRAFQVIFGLFLVFEGFMGLFLATKFGNSTVQGAVKYGSKALEMAAA